MKVLKRYVHNRTHPEGFIAECYIAKKAVEFCTEHLSDVRTIGMPLSQNMGLTKPLLGCSVTLVDRNLLNQAHLYVLENTEEVLPYIEYDFNSLCFQSFLMFFLYTKDRNTRIFSVM